MSCATSSRSVCVAAGARRAGPWLPAGADAGARPGAGAGARARRAARAAGGLPAAIAVGGVLALIVRGSCALSPMSRVCVAPARQRRSRVHRSSSFARTRYRSHARGPGSRGSLDPRADMTDERAPAVDPSYVHAGHANVTDGRSRVLHPSHLHAAVAPTHGDEQSNRPPPSEMLLVDAAGACEARASHRRLAVGTVAGRRLATPPTAAASASMRPRAAAVAASACRLPSC